MGFRVVPSLTFYLVLLYFILFCRGGHGLLYDVLCIFTHTGDIIYSQCSFHLVLTRRMSSGTGTDHPSGAPEFTSGRIRFAQYLVFCSVLQIIVCRFVIFTHLLYYLLVCIV